MKEVVAMFRVVQEAAARPVCSAVRLARRGIARSALACVVGLPLSATVSPARAGLAIPGSGNVASFLGNSWLASDRGIVASDIESATPSNAASPGSSYGLTSSLESNLRRLQNDPRLGTSAHRADGSLRELPASL